jgi:hypothetical protein
LKRFGIVKTILASAVFCAAAFCADATPGNFLVTNDDVASPFTSTASFYPVNSDGTLGARTSVPLGSNGIAGGYFAAAQG